MPTWAKRQLHSLTVWSASMRLPSHKVHLDREWAYYRSTGSGVRSILPYIGMKLGIWKQCPNCHKYVFFFYPNGLKFALRAALLFPHLAMKPGSEKLSEVSSFIKFLGIRMDSKLTWREHVRLCKSKLASVIYAIKMLLSPTKVLLTLLCLG